MKRNEQKYFFEKIGRKVVKAVFELAILFILLMAITGISMGVFTQTVVNFSIRDRAIQTLVVAVITSFAFSFGISVGMHIFIAEKIMKQLKIEV